MSHTNKPEVGLLNRVKENKGEAYMYPFHQDLYTTQPLYFWCNFLAMKMLYAKKVAAMFMHNVY